MSKQDPAPEQASATDSDAKLQTAGVQEPPTGPELKTLVEVILFTSETPLTLQELLEIFQRKDYTGPLADVEALEQALRALQTDYRETGRAFQLRQIAGGWQLLSRPELADFVRLARMQRENKKLSRAALETLAIVAYRQPIPRAEIEFIRGVGVDYALNKLLEKQLVESCGRSEELPGRPLLYRTTQEFMAYFGLNSLEDLPRLDELKADENFVAEAFHNALNPPESALANQTEGEPDSPPSKAPAEDTPGEHPPDNPPEPPSVA